MDLATRNKSTLLGFTPHLYNRILLPKQMPEQQLLSFVYDVAKLQAAQVLLSDKNAAFFTKIETFERLTNNGGHADIASVE